MNLNETNTNEAETQTTLPFWRDSTKTWRETITGVNEYTIHTYVQIKERKIYETDIDWKLLKPSERQKLKFFIDEINDCLNDIYMGKEGFLFTKEQVKEVKRLLKGVQVKRSCKYGCYCCWM